jgi:hypothetical protein
MHLTTSRPTADPDREQDLLDEGWVLLKEPSSSVAALIASAPYMLISAGITFALSALFVPLSLDYFGLGGGSFSLSIGLPAVLTVAGVLVFHELLHLVCIPKKARSGRTSLGITPMGGFVVCEEELERNRHLLISLAPFFTLSVAGTFILGAVGLLNPLLLTALTLNSLGSSVDLLTATNVLRQVPNGAVITAEGMHTYWRA